MCHLYGVKLVNTRALKTCTFVFQQTDLQGSGRPLLRTPNRFTRTSQSAYWNTGNGSPDAVCFTVDKPGIVIAGLCVYGGGGQYDYDLETTGRCELEI